MRFRFLVGLLTLACLLNSPIAEGADPTEVNGQVLDATGKPVEGILVDTHWRSKQGRWTARRGMRTDANGKFSFKTRIPRRPNSLMALDESQEHGAVVTLDAEAAKKSIVLKLRRTALVRGAFTCEVLGHQIETAYVSFTARTAGIAVASHRGAASYALRLPPSEYAMTIGGVDCEGIRQRLTLTEDMRIVDMGKTDLKPTIIAQHYGKAPPTWNVTDARGIDAKTTLADLEGKWVLLEFWGFW